MQSTVPTWEHFCQTYGADPAHRTGTVSILIAKWGQTCERYGSLIRWTDAIGDVARPHRSFSRCRLRRSRQPMISFPEAVEAIGYRHAVAGLWGL